MKVHIRVDAQSGLVPLSRVKNLPYKTREPEPFTQEEINKILNELTGQEKNLIQFAFYSGLRSSELIALRWQDAEFEQNRIFIETSLRTRSTERH